MHGGSMRDCKRIAHASTRRTPRDARRAVQGWDAPACLVTAGASWRAKWARATIAIRCVRGNAAGAWEACVYELSSAREHAL
eukprot:11455946-Alexandrium_andersonii.AAC.1